jgi:hypothetical protein
MPGSPSRPAKADTRCPLQCHHRPAPGPVVSAIPAWPLNVATRDVRSTSTPAGESFEANIVRRASPGKVRSWRNLRVRPQTAFWRIALVRLAPRSEGVRPTASSAAAVCDGYSTSTPAVSDARTRRWCTLRQAHYRFLGIRASALAARRARQCVDSARSLSRCSGRPDRADCVEKLGN